MNVLVGAVFAVFICAHVGLLWRAGRNKAWLAVGINSAMILQWIWWVNQWVVP